MTNGTNVPDSTVTESVAEVSSDKLLSACLAKIAEYGRMNGYDPSGAFFNLSNGKSIYVTSKPANMTLTSGEICIGLYDKNGRIQRSEVVTSSEQALTVAEEWGK